MLCIISGTNRKGSKTLQVAKEVMRIAQNAGTEVQLIDLADIPVDFIGNEQYAPDKVPSWLKDLQAKSMIPASHFVFVAPEYNGSIPGYLKLFIDALSVHELKETFKSKQAALIGVASGRAGNLRGMDHLSSIMNHMGCHVLPNIIPLSKIGSVMNEAGRLNEDTSALIESLLNDLVKV